ncbi:LysR family transcriptional regulator [Thiocapsa sp.]|nr:LysR family transcriptional regulator [Thiocapsa sp.]
MGRGRPNIYAAKRLETTPAAVSRRIKALEERLGVRLLQRTIRKIQLTEAGELYFREVSRLLGDLMAVEHQLETVTAEPTGELRIVGPMSFGQRRLAPVVTRFALGHPKLRVTLKLEDRETDIVSEGFDLAIRIAYPSDSSLVARTIGRIPRYLCASPEYLARRGTPQTPRDLLQHDCLHYNVISEREEWTFGGPQGDETLVIKAAFCCNNGEVLAEAAMQGLGITLLPDFIVKEALSYGRLVRVLEGRERAPLILSVLYPSRRHVPVKTRLFIDYVIEQLT